MPTTITIPITTASDDYETYTADDEVDFETTTGYIIDVPENPLILPTQPSIKTTTEAILETTTEDIRETTTEDTIETTIEDIAETTTAGYTINVPEDPLTLPTKSNEEDTTEEIPVEDVTGYVINTPENPLTFPPQSEGRYEYDKSLFIIFPDNLGKIHVKM